MPNVNWSAKQNSDALEVNWRQLKTKIAVGSEFETLQTVVEK